MTVCCGMSGSGKSSLAMDTIYAEGQRRYVESLSAYARQFVGQMQKPALRPHRGIVAGHRHRAEADGAHAAFDRRHGDRDLRLSADSDGPAGAALLSRLRHSDRHADLRRDHRQDSPRAGRDEALLDGAFGNQCRRQIRNPVGRDSGRRLCPYAGRWEDPFGRYPAVDRSAAQAPGRGGDRSDHGPLRRPAARWPTRSKPRWAWARACCTSPGRSTTCRNRKLADRNPQPAFCLRPLRAELRAAVAAQFFLQQCAGLVPGLRRLGDPNRGQSGGSVPRSEADAARGGRGLVARCQGSALRGDAHGAWPPRLRCRSTCRSTI